MVHRTNFCEVENNSSWVGNDEDSMDEGGVVILIVLSAKNLFSKVLIAM